MIPFSLSGKLALLTGATRGIGQGVARALAESGASVILVGRDSAELSRSAAELSPMASAVRLEQFDLSITIFRYRIR